MEGYTLQKWFDFSYRVKHEGNTDFIVYYPHFDYYMAPVDKKIYKDWVFEAVIVPENENEENEYVEWYLSESEQEVIKDLVRKENPEDLVQFEFLDWGASNYLVYKKYLNNKEIRYITAYPTKEKLSKWLFYCEVDKEEGNYELEDWKLGEDRQETIKYYICNVLKPSDLYEERKETDMKEGYENLNVAVPKEYATEVMNIITRYDGIKVPPTTDQDCASCEMNSQITELNDLNVNLRKSASELIKHILEEIKGEMDYEIYEDMLRTLTKEQINEFGLQEYEVKPKVVKTKYKVTKEVTSYIEVITREGENALECLSYHENESDFNSLFENGEDDTSYSYSYEDEEELTYNEASNYLDEVIIDSDLDNEIRD